MNRRNFLKLIATSTAFGAVGQDLLAKTVISEDGDFYTVDSLKKEAGLSKEKDIYLDPKYHKSFYSVIKKLNIVQRNVGFGNYNIISFDETLKHARMSSKIGTFTKEELEFMEYIFYYNPDVHGFYGERTCNKITEIIKKNEIIKVPYTGHYLFKDRSLETYNTMLKDIGDSIVLTSGVRSIVKQMKLFLDKLESTNLSLSKASISLAPPAYSFHSSGDFDVGKKGLGYDNFTERFALTEEFSKMIKLTYVDIRYTVNNKDGVRYEPWHVTVV
jgi:zinc D-Ala-D-Ala carboxypeptidase